MSTMNATAFNEEEMTLRIARKFSDRVADMCNVDKEDHWKYHYDDVIDDVKFIVKSIAEYKAVL